jgi:glycosyltransferase involved in cell wall biosynthesis
MGTQSRSPRGSRAPGRSTAHETAGSRSRARPPRVCLVTPTHIAHNPRLVKEADTLAAAGYDVRVVGCQLTAWIAERDLDLARRRMWRYDVVRAVPRGPWGRWLRTRSHVRTLLYRGLSSRIVPRRGLDERALVRFYPELVEEVCREPADLYVAHTLEALPVAAAAGRRFGARLGYDAEDLYTGELGAAQEASPRQRLVERVEGASIRACDYVSAPSPEVSAALARIYGIPQPIVLHNVFRWADRDRLDGLVKDRRGPDLSLYWYSQTIGPDRGLEDAIRACGLLRGRLQLHVRGVLPDGERGRLATLARECGTADRLLLHASVPPDELLSRAAEHDVGLALESPVSESRRLSVTNKLFVYLLAGLGVAATDVPGQRTVMESCRAAGFVYRPGDTQALARGLQGWLDDPERLARSRQAALEAARQRWNWEAESRAFLATVEQLVGVPESRLGVRAMP